jgi:hypothetical protein
MLWGCGLLFVYQPDTHDNHMHGAVYGDYVERHMRCQGAVEVRCPGDVGRICDTDRSVRHGFIAKLARALSGAVVVRRGQLPCFASQRCEQR